MDPVMKMYMFYHWVENQNENVELFKNHGYLIGSFTNPEAVKHMMNANTYSVDEESFEAASEFVVKSNKEKIAQEHKQEIKKKRRRKKVN